jgi:PIN domain nuclease of toxin-antitoxin system
MKLLLDTHLLLWANVRPELLSSAARERIDHPSNEIVFSVVSIWEIAIKHSKGRAEFQTDPKRFCEALLRIGSQELPILGHHAVVIAKLPWIHKDPFDRMLIAQAMAEGISLLTADATIARYPGPIQLV